jgi:hypothetical protein
MSEHKDKYLIIVEESMRGAFNTFEEALPRALDLAKPGEFLIQRCVSEAENTQVICSMWPPGETLAPPDIS